MDLLLRLPPTLRRLALTHPNSFYTPSQRHVSTHVAASTPLSEPLASPSPKPLTSSTLNSYTHTPPPNPSNLSSARAYFTRRAPLLLYSSPTFRGIPASPYPEVAFLGRSNVGKSSLLNALFNRVHTRPPAHVSKRAGRTRTINGFGISSSNGSDGQPSSSPSNSLSPSSSSPAASRGPGHASETLRSLGPGALVVVDMPGYGGGSRAEWGVEALKFLRGRAQLRRTYVLVDAEHGPKPSDVQLLAHLRGEGVPVQVVLSKVDKLLLGRGKARQGAQGMGPRLERLHAVIAEVREQVEGATGERGWLGDVLCCSAEKMVDLAGPKNRARIGVDELRWAVLTACGMDGL